MSFGVFIFCRIRFDTWRDWIKFFRIRVYWPSALECAWWVWFLRYFSSIKSAIVFSHPLARLLNKLIVSFDCRLRFRFMRRFSFIKRPLQESVQAPGMLAKSIQIQLIFNWPATIHHCIAIYQIEFIHYKRRQALLKIEIYFKQTNNSLWKKALWNAFNFQNLHKKNFFFWPKTFYFSFKSILSSVRLIVPLSIKVPSDFLSCLFGSTRCCVKLCGVWLDSLTWFGSFLTL